MITTFHVRTSEKVTQVDLERRAYVKRFHTGPTFNGSGNIVYYSWMCFGRVFVPDQGL